MVGVADKVLVAYASRYGSTREIADEIARVLVKRGLEVDVKPADSIFSLTPYNAVVLGSAIYYGDWLDAATDFLRRFSEELSARSVWLFSSGTTRSGAPTETMRGWSFPEKLATLRRDIAPQDVARFHGKFDAKRLSVYDWFTHRSLRGVTSDDRDWGEVDAWAGYIAGALQASLELAPPAEHGPVLARCIHCELCYDIAPDIRGNEACVPVNHTTLEAMAVCPTGAINWREDPSRESNHNSSTVIPT